MLISLRNSLENFENPKLLTWEELGNELPKF